MDKTLLEQDERLTEIALDFFGTLVDCVKAELFTGSKISSEFLPSTLKGGVAAHAFIRALVDSGVIVPLGTSEKKGCRYAHPENVGRETRKATRCDNVTLETSEVKGSPVAFGMDNYNLSLSIR